MSQFLANKELLKADFVNRNCFLKKAKQIL